MDSIKVYDFDELLQLPREQFEDNVKHYFAGKSFTTANKLLWSVSLFCAANRYLFDTKHVSMFLPKRAEIEDPYKPYPKEIIKELLDESTFHNEVKAAVYIMAVGGIRVGALAGIKKKDLTWLEAARLYGLHVYPDDREHHYYTFLTPQASAFLQNMNFEGFTKNKKTIEHSIWRMLLKEGYRTKGERSDRNQYQLNHSFRKFFRTALTNAGIRDDHAKALMGQAVKLDRIYSLPDIDKWYIASEYEKAIQELTF